MLDCSRLRNILVVRLDNIGDVVMLGPALRALRAAAPGARLTLLASPAGAQAAPLLPWIDEVIERRPIWQEIGAERRFSPQEDLDFVQELSRREFDAAFIFTSFRQSPYPPAMLCYLAGIPVRAGIASDFGGRLLTHACQRLPVELHQTERSLRLLEALGIEVPDRELEASVAPEALTAAEELLALAGVPVTSPFIALAPGASSSARRYDSVRFLAAARLLAARAELPVVVLGTAREAGAIAPLLGDGVISLAGLTGLPEFAALISMASLVVCNNSAALHLADAFRRPVLTLYSGTDLEGQWRPRAAPHRLLRCEAACSPCYLIECPIGTPCLDFSPEEVVEAALGLLQEAGKEGVAA